MKATSPPEVDVPIQVQAVQAFHFQVTCLLGSSGTCSMPEIVRNPEAACSSVDIKDLAKRPYQGQAGPDVGTRGPPLFCRDQA